MHDLRLARCATTIPYVPAEPQADQRPMLWGESTGENWWGLDIFLFVCWLLLFCVNEPVFVCTCMCVHACVCVHVHVAVHACALIQYHVQCMYLHSSHHIRHHLLPSVAAAEGPTLNRIPVSARSGPGNHVTGAGSSQQAARAVPRCGLWSRQQRSELRRSHTRPHQ